MDKYVCHAYIGDIFIKQKIRLEGSLQKCSYCKKRRKTVDLSTLAESRTPILRIVNDSIKVIQAKSISYEIDSYKTHYSEV